MRLIITSILLLLGNLAFSQTARELVRSGNEAYKIDSVNQAIESYQKAMDLDPKLEEAVFNMGDAYFKADKYADAAKTFNQVAQTTQNKQLKSDAYFNEGDAHMQTQKFEDAINSYKNSMRANPENNKARYNYEFARKMLKEQQKQEQENKDNQDKKDDNEDKKDDKNKDKNKDNKDDKNKDGDDNKDKKDQDKDKDKNKDQKDKDDQNKDKDQDKDQDQKEKDKDKGDEEKDKGNPDKNKGDQEESKPQPQQPGQLSKADAERLLKAMEDNEKKTRDKVAKMKAKSTTKKKSDKDW